MKLLLDILYVRLSDALRDDSSVFQYQKSHLIAISFNKNI